jgi:hypothetical protein
LIGLLASALLIGMIIKNQNSDDNLHFALSLFITCLFALILVAYMTVHIMLIRRLRTFYPNFYKREQKQIKISFASVVFSLSCRILINTIMMFNFQEALDESFDNGTWLL